MTRRKNKTKDDPLQDYSTAIEQMGAGEILERGEAVAALMNGPIFMTTVGETMVEIQNDWIATNPHEKEKREGLYQEICAVNRVMARMDGILQATQGVNLQSHKEENINPKFQ